VAASDEQPLTSVVIGEARVHASSEMPASPRPDTALLIGEGTKGDASPEGAEGEEADSAYSPFDIPESILGKVVWLVGLPIALAMAASIPSPSSPRWKGGHWYLLTIAMCLVWVAGLTFLLLWVTLTMGVVLGISENVMGLVWMAFGTSVPDVLQSLSAARQGLGDQAIAGAIGSNVFNIVLAIPLAWLCYTGIAYPNSTVIIVSQNLVLTLMVILICLALSMLVVHFGNWRLTKLVGAVCGLLYLIFIAICVLLELDTLG
jgi:hypothetical protein